MKPAGPDNHKSGGSNASASGFLYALTNPSMPGLVKVGMTQRRPEDRLHELSAATGVPTPFELRHSIHVTDAHTGEKALHAKWEKEGLRTTGGREFFRMDLHRAIADMEGVARSQQGKGNKKALLERGFALLRGNEDTLRDIPQALQYFEQAAALGSSAGAYWAGRACEMMAGEQKRRGNIWRQKAVAHYQTARRQGHLKAEARASWLYSRAKQWPQAELAWQTFLDGVAALPAPDGETLRWLARYLERTPPARVDLRHPLWKRHHAALKATIREMKMDKAAASLARTRPRYWPWVVGGVVLVLVLAGAMVLHP
jgi:hypothetical protein